MRQSPPGALVDERQPCRTNNALGLIGAPDTGRLRPDPQPGSPPRAVLATDQWAGETGERPTKTSFSTSQICSLRTNDSSHDSCTQTSTGFYPTMVSQGRSGRGRPPRQRPD